MDWQLIGISLTGLMYTVGITVYAVSTRTMAEVSQKEIEKLNEIHREDFKELQQQMINSTEKIYQELKEIRKEIANNKNKLYE